MDNKLNVFYDKVLIKNDVELLDKVLQIYAILNFKDESKLVKSQRNVLLYYVKNGLNEETLENIKLDHPKYNNNYLHQLNKQLRDKGYLIKDQYNEHKFYLNAELEQIRKKFVQDKAKGYIISFGKEN